MLTSLPLPDVEASVDESFDTSAIMGKLYYDLAGSSVAMHFPDMRQMVDDSLFFYASDYPFTSTSIITEQENSLYDAPYMDELLRESDGRSSDSCVLGMLVSFHFRQYRCNYVPKYLKRYSLVVDWRYTVIAQELSCIYSL